MNLHNLNLRISKIETRIQQLQLELDILKQQRPDPDAWPDELAAAKRALASNNIALMKLRLGALQAKRGPAGMRASEASKSGNERLAQKLWGYRNESYDTVVALETRIALLETKGDQAND